MLGLSKQSKNNLLPGHTLCKSLSSEVLQALTKFSCYFPPVEMLIHLVQALVPGDTDDFVVRSYLKNCIVVYRTPHVCFWELRVQFFSHGLHDVRILSKWRSYVCFILKLFYVVRNIWRIFTFSNFLYPVKKFSKYFILLFAYS